MNVFILVRLSVQISIRSKNFCKFAGISNGFAHSIKNDIRITTKFLLEKIQKYRAHHIVQLIFESDLIILCHVHVRRITAFFSLSLSASITRTINKPYKL